MHKIDLFRTNLLTCRVVEKFYLPGFHTELRTNVAEIQIDGTVKALDFVLNKQRNLDVAIFKELIHLLSNDGPVICIKVLAHILMSRLRIDNELFGFCALNEIFHCIKMLVCDE